MRGPLPLEASERAGRSKAPAIPTTNLPVSGYRGEFPEPPEALSDEVRRLYVELWRTPSAAAWHESDAEIVVELVRLRRAVSVVLDRGEFPPGHVTGRIGAIEDRLGLSPKARAALRWKIVDDPPDVDESDDDLGDVWLPDE